MRIIPAVDILDGKVVRLLAGDYDRSTVYADDPAAAVRAFAGADLVHVVDLDAARDRRPSVRWEEIAAAGTVQAAGGIRTASAVGHAIAAGVARVVVGTAAVDCPNRLASMVAAAGEGRLVVAVDIIGERAMGHGWTGEGRDWRAVVAGAAAAGVGVLLVTSVAADGAMGGPDISLISEARHAWDGELIASGGVGSLDDITRLAAAGADAVVVGRGLYETRFTLLEALEAGGAVDRDEAPAPSRWGRTGPGISMRSIAHI